MARFFSCSFNTKQDHCCYGEQESKAATLVFQVQSWSITVMNGKENHSSVKCKTRTLQICMVSSKASFLSFKHKTKAEIMNGRICNAENVVLFSSSRNDPESCNGKLLKESPPKQVVVKVKKKKK